MKPKLPLWWNIARVFVAVLGWLVFFVWMCPLGLLLFFVFLCGIPIWCVLGNEDAAEKFVLGAAVWPMIVTKWLVHRIDTSLDRS